jgi:hypothetical protein
MGNLELHEMNLTQWLLGLLHHFVPNSLETTPKWRLSTLWQFYRSETPTFFFFFGGIGV